MHDERLRTARDEILEIAAASGPLADPPRARDHAVDTALRLLGHATGVTGASSEDSTGDDDSQAAIDVEGFEPIGAAGEGQSLPPADDDVADEFAWVDPAVSAPALDDSAERSTLWPSADLLSAQDDATQDLDTSAWERAIAAAEAGSSAAQQLSIDDQRVDANSPQVPLFSHEELATREAQAFEYGGPQVPPASPPSHSEINDLVLRPGDVGRIEQLPYRPGEQGHGGIRLLPAMPMPANALSAGDARTTWPRFPAETADGGPSLARPLVMLTVSEVERLAVIGEALRSASERDERVLRQIVEERIEHHNYVRWAQERALYGDYQ